MNNVPFASFINKKNKKVYRVFGYVTNATNAQDGQIMVLYAGDEGKLFVREGKEFQEKFERFELDRKIQVVK